MSLIVRLIAKYALWIYILCGIGMIYYVQVALSARTEGVQAMFSLEREQAAKRVYRSAGMILVLLLIVVGVYGLSNYADVLPAQIAPKETTESPTGEPATLTAQALDDLTGTVKATETPPGGTSQRPTAEPTPTRKPLRTNVPIVVPTLPLQDTPTPQIVPVVCPYPSVQIMQPGQNQVINTGIEVIGTATKTNFDRYEFKFQSRDLVGDEWHWVETFRTPVTGGNLGYWHTAHLPPGRYQFLLIAIDKSGNSEECIVPVIIRH